MPDSSATPAPLVADPSLFFICRMCARMADQIAQGSTVCRLACGGPRKGRAYPEYRGPLPPSWLRAHCAVCGDPAAHRVEVHGRGEVGACAKHLALLLPPGAGAPAAEAAPPATPRLARVSLYDLLGLDPVRDLGFDPEPGGPSNGTVPRGD